MYDKYLGRGSYGVVQVIDGYAVKKFTRIPHIIQEYATLSYLSDCEHIVRCTGVNFREKQIYMELYDNNLREWLKINQTATIEERKIIVRDMLRGLVELHDRGLAHADLKPGNMLIRNNPLKLVLGDLGFSSVYKYIKCERTTDLYRDTIALKDQGHDMYSLGICILEIMGNIILSNRQWTYNELKNIVERRIEDELYKKIIHNLLHDDRSRRPTARQLLSLLFNESSPKWKRLTTVLLPAKTAYIREDDPNPCPYKKAVLNVVKPIVTDRQLKRGKKGFGALMAYFEINKVEYKDYFLYASATLLILSSLFGVSSRNFREDHVKMLTPCDDEMFFTVLENLLSDKIFIRILLSPCQNTTSSSV